MSFLEELQKTAVEAALKAFNGYQLAVSENQLNSLAVTLAQSDDVPIIGCQPGVIVIAGKTRVAGMQLTYSTRLALEACEISPSRKQLILRRLDNVDLGGNNLATALFARVIKTLLCGLFGIDPARFALDGIAGVRVEKDLITADFDAMGATEAILEALTARLPITLVPLLETVSATLAPGLSVAGNALLAHISIEDIAVETGEISGKLRIHPAGHE